MFTKEALVAQIRAMGIGPEDTVLVHSSLRSVGPVENGADGIIDAFKEVLTDGLLLVPTHTWWDVTRKQPYYDVRSSVPNIGTLPRVAAFRPDGVRSLHPTHSVTGFGKKAAEFLAGEEKFGTKYSEELMDEKGRIRLDQAGLLAYNHGEYFGLKKNPIGKFGYSVMKAKTKKRLNKKKHNSTAGSRRKK